MESPDIIEKYKLEIIEDIEIDDNEVDVTCRICGEQCKRIYGRHLKHSHNGITTKEYKKLFPNVPITSLKDSQSTSVNSGKHMKEDKYRKMFSEKIRGEKNPMHRSKTSDEFRKSISPFSIEFYNKRFPELTIEERKDKLHEFAKRAVSERICTTNIEYYLNQGMDQEEAEKALSKRQTTFSKEICIEKHGEERGIEVWMERQKKWLSNLPKLNYSKISQVLFIEIWEMIKGEFEDIYFATLDQETKEIYDGEDRNFEYTLRTEKSFIKPDFYIPSIKKIIEFDGVYYHRTTPENDKRERERDSLIVDMGIEVLHISENDYKKDKNETIQKCVDFILG